MKLLQIEYLRFRFPPFFSIKNYLYLYRILIFILTYINISDLKNEFLTNFTYRCIWKPFSAIIISNIIFDYDKFHFIF